ncbi:MAG: bifunctional homocysteine S-methyltransferase/methylenetetrahydrofolate reductase [Saccharofermentanales bacterium]
MENDLISTPGIASPFFFEGAFGTYYYKKLHSEEPCELGNLYHAGVVAGIHAEYIAAGVDAIKTNTFGANYYNFPDRDLLKTIIRRGYEIAESAVKGTGTRLFADIGFIAAENEATDISGEYLFIAEEFIKLGAVCYIFETMSEYDSIVPAIRLIRTRKPEAFIVVSFAVMQDGYTGKGNYYKNLIADADSDSDIDVCGLNCLCGPNHLFRLLQDLPAGGKPLCAMPNSGYPSTVNGRTIFVDNVEYFSQKIRDIRALGVDYLGGCCGTTPEHMKAVIAALGSGFDKGSGVETSNGYHGQELKLKLSAPAAAAHPVAGSTKANIFLDKLNSGHKILAVEIDPPADTDTAFIIGASASAALAGADIITIADSPLARSRADSIILAAKIRRETGVEVLPHMSCRDRNHIGIKASLLGAAIEDIRNILVITGDPVSSADKAEVRGMFSFNSFKLISYIKRLNEEVFLNAPFGIAAALNVNAPSFDAELARALQKQENGADVFLTQPVFSKTAAENIIKARKALRAKLLVGILPVAGYRNALFLNNEVPGIRIPDEFLDRLKDASPEASSQYIIDFGKEIIEMTYDHADGYYLMTPLKKIGLVCEILAVIRTIEREKPHCHKL